MQILHVLWLFLMLIKSKQWWVLKLHLSTAERRPGCMADINIHMDSLCTEGGGVHHKCKTKPARIFFCLFSEWSLWIYSNYFNDETCHSWRKTKLKLSLGGMSYSTKKKKKKSLAVATCRIRQSAVTNVLFVVIIPPLSLSHLSGSGNFPALH